MNKLFLLLILLLCSCTDDKPSGTVQTENIETGNRSGFSKQLASILPDTSYVKDQQTHIVYNSIIKGIRPDMPNDSLKEVLQTIHYWDQVYRDSLMEGNAWILDKIKRDKYRKEMTRWDKMNQRVVLYLLNNLGGWPDTKDMGEEASMAIWLVIHHNYNTREFSRQILPYLNKAYHVDSVISKNRYVGLFDRVNYKVNGYSKYGTYGFHKDNYPDSVRDRINLERTAIGLNKL